MHYMKNKAETSRQRERRKRNDQQTHRTSWHRCFRFLDGSLSLGILRMGTRRNPPRRGGYAESEIAETGLAARSLQGWPPGA